jgi:hypothetical protein
MTKLSNGYDNHYRSIAPPKSGLLRQGSALTALSKVSSKLLFNCEHCDLPFEKYACWAKRTSHHYCSRACAWAAKVIQIPKNCVVCDVEMLLNPTKYTRISTCSKDCSRKRRVKSYTNLRTSPDYLTIVNRIKKIGSCNACGVTSGPWVAAGIKTWVEDGLSCADGNSARLICKKCHMGAARFWVLRSAYMLNRKQYYEDKK